MTFIGWSTVISLRSQLENHFSGCNSHLWRTLSVRSSESLKSSRHERLNSVLWRKLFVPDEETRRKGLLLRRNVSLRSELQVWSFMRLPQEMRPGSSSCSGRTPRRASDTRLSSRELLQSVVRELGTVDSQYSSLDSNDGVVWRVAARVHRVVGRA